MKAYKHTIPHIRSLKVVVPAATVNRSATANRNMSPN